MKNIKYCICSCKEKKWKWQFCEKDKFILIFCFEKINPKLGKHGIIMASNNLKITKLKERHNWLKKYNKKDIFD